MGKDAPEFLLRFSQVPPRDRLRESPRDEDPSFPTRTDDCQRKSQQEEG
jgi:hypothetical protein